MLQETAPFLFHHSISKKLLSAMYGFLNDSDNMLSLFNGHRFQLLQYIFKAFRFSPK